MSKFSKTDFSKIIKWAGFLMLLVLVCFSCKNDINEINQLVKRDDLNVEVTKEVELIYSDSAVIKVIVNADLMKTYKEKIEPRQEFPNGIKVDFYNDNMKSVSKLTSNHAIRYDRKKEIIMTDSVVWQSIKNEVLETEQLIWNESTKKVYSKGHFVKVTTADDIIYGYGFEAEEDFSKWKINAPQGTMSVKE